MKMKLLNLSDKSPVLRYGLLAIALILWYFLLYDPMSSRQESYKKETRATSLKIKRLKKEIDKNRNLDQALKNARGKYAILKKEFLSGKDPQMAGSILQNILLKDAEIAGLDVASYKISPTKRWEEHQVVSVDMRVKAQTLDLVHFLRLLEKEKGIFRFAHMNITKVLGRNQHLRVNLKVEGLYSEGATQ
jgi:hypothetical protein